MNDGRALNGRTPRGLPVAERFWGKVLGGSVEGCWLWLGAPDQAGYGRIRVAGRNHYAHRWAYEHLRTEIPQGLHLDHLCRNRSCVNPWHLEPVTPGVNTRRGEGHGSETHCPHGHAYDEENTYRHGGRRYCRACRPRLRAEFKARQEAA